MNPCSLCRTLNHAIYMILAGGALLSGAARASAVTNSWVYFDANGKLAYRVFGSGNKIMDFSHAGYMGGGVALPTVAAVQTLNPSGGDDRTALQNAINAVAARPLVNGFRGALQLGPGTFSVSGQININAGGVVVRGSGSGAGGTVIVMTNAASFTLFNLAGSGSRSQSGKVSITDPYVPSGTTNFTVSNASGFSVGDTVVVGRTVTTNWIHFVGMDTLVRSGATQTWISAGTVLLTDRKISQISGNQIGLDAPLTDSFDTNYLGTPAGTMSHYTWSGRISQVGLENLKIVAPPVTTGYVSVNLGDLIDGWVRNVAIQDGVNCLNVSDGSKQVTVDNVTITHTVISTASAAPADFACTGTEVLFNKCKAMGTGSWPFVTRSTSTGPIVLLNFFTTQDRGVAPHERWTTGILADNGQFPNSGSSGDKQGIAYANRGTDGSGHGWTTGWSVGWNCIAPFFLVSVAPGTESWNIGGLGSKSSSSDPDGIFEALGNIVTPHSLYLAQLEERLGGAAVENAGYPLFTISNSPPLRIIAAGTNTTFTVTVGDPTSMSNVVALSLSGLPVNASASFSTNAVKGAGSATLTVTFSNSVAPGNYALNVIGTSAGLSHTSMVSVVVGNFSVSASPAVATILAGAATNYIVTLTTNTDFTGSVDLGVSGLPAGASADFAPPTLTAGGNSILSLTTSSNTAPGNYTVTINGTNGPNIASTTVTLTITTVAANPGTLVWTNGAVDINWSSSLNWTNITSGGNGPPGISNDVVLANFSTVIGNAVDNIVNSDTTIESLSYQNTNGFHTTQIAQGETLTIIGSGGLLAGTESDLGNAVTVPSAITGAGGSLVVSNAAANVIVRQASGGSGSALKAILDLSGLDTFQAAVGRIEVGALGGFARPSGILFLAKTNFITASGASPAIILGGQGGSAGGNAGNGSFLFLGQTNVIFANGISVGTVKQSGCSMLFAPGVLANNPTAYFRAADGVSAVPNWFIADSGSSSGTINTSGTNDFSGGAVDALLNSLIIARSSTGSGLGNPSGTLTFGAGTINAGTMQISVQGANGANFATGTANVNGSAQLLVGTSLELAHVVGGTGAATTTGTLNLNGGTVQVTNIFGGGGIANISLNSGTLNLAGSGNQSGKISNIGTLTIGVPGAVNPALLTSAASVGVSNAIAIAANGVIAGNTVITSPGIIVNGTLSPGVNGIGWITNSGAATLGGGGHLAVDIQNANGAPGTDWDFLSVSGALDVQSVATNPFTINLQSLSSDDSDGLTNFDFNTNFDWTIGAAGSVINFDAGKFTVDTSQFGEDLAGGYFYARTNGNALVLSFTNNHPPTAGTTTVYRSGNVAMIPIASLAAHWSDPDGDPVVLLSVDGSLNGAGVGADATFVYYTNFNGAADVIHYTVADVRTNPPAIYQAGDTVRTAVGSIVVLPQLAIGGLSISGGTLSFGVSNGLPGGNYSILASTNATLPLANWSVIQTGSFDSGGVLQFTNSIDPALPQRFYLLQVQ